MVASVTAFIKLQHSRKPAYHFMVLVIHPDKTVYPCTGISKTLQRLTSLAVTIFPLITDPGTYLISKLWGAALIGWWRLFQSSKSYVHKISRIFIVSFQIISKYCMIHSLIHVWRFFQMHFNLLLIKLLSDFLSVQPCEREALFLSEWKTVRRL